MSKAEASEKIDELQEKTGRGSAGKASKPRRKTAKRKQH
jgi:hypothetical protein